MRPKESPLGLAAFIAAAFVVGCLIAWMARHDFVKLVQDAIEAFRGWAL